MDGDKYKIFGLTKLLWKEMCKEIFKEKTSKSTILVKQRDFFDFMVMEQINYRNV